MTHKQVWLVTGAGRGLGVEIAKAALAAGHAVVATARDTRSLTEALGEHDDLLAVALDVTDTAAAEAAVQAAVQGFGRLDVLVNNAGSFKAGFFEEMNPRTGVPRTRRRCSVRSTSPAPHSRSFARSARVWWSPSPRPPASRPRVTS
jgi:NAD(P)-dependent dehydrogenase (short-subunit alcohol dehydrogenase family)